MIRPHRLAERVEGWQALDPPGKWVTTQVGKLIPYGAFKDLLSGTWLGHALHPMLTDVPIGAWTSALVLDAVGGEGSRDAARRLVGLGVLSAVPTAAAGLSDYSDTMGEERRVGTVHALANVLGLACFTASWFARRSGRHQRGVVLGLAGTGAVAVGGFLGGHLSYSQGVGVDQTAFATWPEEWRAVADDADLSLGQAVAVDVDGNQVMLTRTADGVFALADACTHRGGPLSEGMLSDDCVTCPWHGSTFRLADGEIITGPASTPQPAFDARVANGRIEIRARL